MNYADFILSNAGIKIEQNTATEEEKKTIGQLLKLWLSNLAAAGRTVGGWLKDASITTWGWTKSVWSWLKLHTVECTGWTVEKAKLLWHHTCDYAQQAWGWTKDVAWAWTKEQSSKLWSKVCELSSTGWDYTKLGAVKTWSAIVVSYDWTANQVKSIASWTWTHLRDLASKAMSLLATAATAVTKPIGDALLGLTFPMEITARVPAGAVLEGSYMVWQDLGARGRVIRTLAADYSDFQIITSMVFACNGVVY